MGLATEPLRILHIFRTPMGGLFRHVLDLARGQIERGHAVGLVCDASTGGKAAEEALAALRPSLALGLLRLPMTRDPGPQDVRAMMAIARQVRRLKPDVLHGHGSKGGLYARLPFPSGRHDRVIRAYTPHGGSFHYGPGSLHHRVYMGAERLLRLNTDLFLFESDYVRARFETFLGTTQRLARVVPNGLSDAEFEPVPQKPPDYDLLYVGELRLIKGVDLLIAACARLHRERVSPRLLIVGTGPDEARFKAMAAEKGLADRVTFAPPAPIRTILGRARIMVVPSRAESLPYVVLEAAAAGQPLVATRAGGIPEIFGPHAMSLVPPDDAEALAAALGIALARAPEDEHRQAQALRAFVRGRFSMPAMVESVLDGYIDAAREACQP